jgi:hypothetical protein
MKKKRDLNSKLKAKKSQYHRHYRRVEDAITIMTRYRVLKKQGYSLRASAPILGISLTKLHGLKEVCAHLSDEEFDTKAHSVFLHYYK